VCLVTLCWLHAQVGHQLSSFGVAQPGAATGDNGGHSYSQGPAQGQVQGQGQTLYNAFHTLSWDERRAVTAVAYSNGSVALLLSEHPASCLNLGQQGKPAAI
jgi:hypothetical protein